MALVMIEEPPDCTCPADEKIHRVMCPRLDWYREAIKKLRDSMGWDPMADESTLMVSPNRLLGSDIERG